AGCLRAQHAEKYFIRFPPTLPRIHPQNQQRRHRRADGLAVLREPARFAFDVAFEVKLQRRPQAAPLEHKQNRARREENEEQSQVHLCRVRSASARQTSSETLAARALKLIVATACPTKRRCVFARV